MRRPAALTLVLALGVAFLYLPIAVLIVYSFNDSRLVTVWSGVSLRWYEAVFRNTRMLEAAGLSVAVAACAASIALVLGTLAGFALVRHGRFAGRSLFSGLLLGPMMLPEVLTGIALLLLFVAMGETIGWPVARGFWTIVIAHATLAAGFVALIVRARLAGLDRSLEEAALDLGAPPWRVFACVTLPLMLPALGAAWLLAFTLSLDDLVIASFVSGPGATTLPMLIYASIRLGLSPQINALSTLIIATAALAAVAAGLLLRRRQA